MKKNKIKKHNYNKILDDNFNKHLPKNKKTNKLSNTLDYFGNTFNQSSKIDDRDKIKNAYNLLFKKDEINFDDLKNEITFDNFKKSDNKNENENKSNKYKFDTDDDISKSFKKIFREKHISYKPYDKSKHKIKDILDILKFYDKVPDDLFDYSNKKLTKKLEHKNLIDKIISKQDGYGIFNTNKIKINTDLLNKNILSIRYFTGRKFTDNLLKNDYKISKNMVTSKKFNKDIHKLSKNEKTFVMNCKNI